MMFGSNNYGNNAESFDLDPFQLTDAEDKNNLGYCFSLTYKQRLYCFSCFFFVGIMIILWSVISLFITTSVSSFASDYTVGNISMIIAAMFLFGFKKHLKNMCNGVHRAFATFTYFSMIILTLVSVLVLHNNYLCVIFLVLQLVSYLWYIITSMVYYYIYSRRTNVTISV